MHEIFYSLLHEMCHSILHCIPTSCVTGQVPSASNSSTTVCCMNPASLALLNILCFMDKGLRHLTKVNVSQAGTGEVDGMSS